jgi:hypothetical protein
MANEDEIGDKKDNGWDHQPNQVNIKYRISEWETDAGKGISRHRAESRLTQGDQTGNDEGILQE